MRADLKNNCVVEHGGLLGGSEKIARQCDCYAAGMVETMGQNDIEFYAAPWSSLGVNCSRYSNASTCWLLHGQGPEEGLTVDRAHATAPPGSSLRQSMEIGPTPARIAAMARRQVP